MNQDAKKILKIISIFVLFLFIVIYAFFRSKDLIFGVQIKNVNLAVPEALLMENSISKASGENILKVTGNAKNAINLALNGREISVNQQGDFDETIALLSGYNVIEIKAQDKFGNIDEKNYKVINTAHDANLQIKNESTNITN